MSGGGWLRIGHNPDPGGRYMRQTLCNVLYSEDGIPVVLEIRCKDRECCPRAPENHFNVHLVTLYGVQNNRGVGEYVTVQRRYGDTATLPAGARVAAGAVPNGRAAG